MQRAIPLQTFSLAHLQTSKLSRVPAFLLPVPLLFLLWAGNGFPYLSGAAYSDFAISHYPNALYLQRALREWHTFPWWSPLILSGAPFAADPLSSAWYPPHYLGLLFPLPFGLNLVAALHLLWGGLGMYRLLRMENLRTEAALFGALAFQMMPKVWAHYGAGHLTLLYAVMWTPWVVVGRQTADHGRQMTDDRLQTVDRRPSIVHRPSSIVHRPPPIVHRPPSTVHRPPSIAHRLLAGFPAVVWAFLADPRWGAFAGVLWVASHGWRTVDRRPQTTIHRPSSTIHRPPSTVHRLSFLLPLALALPYGLLLLQFARHSTRAALGAAEALTFSLPPTRLLGLLLPLGGSQEFVLYPGAAVAGLALLALLWPRVREATRFWRVTAALALAFALGNALPFFAPLLVRLPGLNLLRAPSRALFLFGMALIVLAAYALDALLDGEVPAGTARRVNLGMVALAGAAALLTLGAGMMSGEWEAAPLWSALLWMAAAFGLAMSIGKRWPSKTASVFLLGVALLDTGGFALRQVEFRPAKAVLQEQGALAAYLAAQPGRFRVYSPSYSLPQQTAAFYGLELADGVNPLQINGYAQFMRATTGVPQEGYSVTLPPFANGEPTRDNAAYTPDARLLGLLNVRFVAAELDLHAEGLRLVKRFGRTRLYVNAFALGPAWVQPADAPPGENAIPLPEEAVHWTPNRVTVEVEGPGLLVLSEVAYPGWQARLDSAPVPLLTPAGILRAVTLPPGKHTAVFFYRPVFLPHP